MTDGCPHLDYREAADGREFDVPRAYCTVADRFVQPMRADVCNARFDLSPADHCEIYREHEGIEDPYLLPDAEARDDETDRDGTEDPNGETDQDGTGKPGEVADPDDEPGDEE